MKILGIILVIFGLAVPLLWTGALAALVSVGCGHNGQSNSGCGLELSDFFDRDTSSITLGVLAVAGVLLASGIACIRSGRKNAVD
jgi:hypothetical protein